MSDRKAYKAEYYIKNKHSDETRRARTGKENRPLNFYKQRRSNAKQ